MTQKEFIIRMIVAFLLGSAIGLERQWRQRMAGLRTNTLVATGAALFVMLSALTPGDSSPTRVAAQVVSGIGFLGGGVILREGLTVRGLNTAATLWCAAAIGSLSGAGLLFHASTGTLAVLAANLLLRPLGYRINQQPLKGTELELCYRCEVICRAKDEAHVRALLLQTVAGGKVMLRSLYSEDLEDTPDRVSVEADLVTQERNDAFLEQIVSRLSLEPGVISISWRIIEQEFG
ncbi:MAG: MgtC/SapB family protein [Oscillatoriaceae bacterium SKW80]|nr:MgtC/SapB family protein [Oscillatoriaceae bacterium SKYG93]MCX8121546.1 MgtC/SapB family protein [Oscillatoriaceae bacterium SKW80]MDW8452868.1 MgtC/SapB family protein [Oscillatoriaceae cyanobacterium SKYGB_i_bin93]HIK27891.1 MgtC/SapB family protein [Oscillatoriaceae cyanobacterium M7585_C2015_266]